MVGPAKRLTPQPTFVVTSEGDLKGKTLVVDDDEKVIGRRDASDIVLPESHVSLTHARVQRQKGAVLLEDLGSTNGTFVNGEPLTTSRALRHGDVVIFGGVETRFEDRGSQLAREDSTEAMEMPRPEEIEEEEIPVLSPRQAEVLRYLRQGLTNPQIAQKLGVTERTVKAHCQEVYDRLGVPNRTAAVDAAHRLGLPDGD
ncbi:FHA domain-containing protein [Egibacter rhizosphaerae]|uniref:FHA domain-containing protein n=1 Tax=Egibacter rhizosphaerae TaxID=1670831 RepID=A0A411YIV0_9ACTN|nr:FHA domain-containing protein [Egibacter rhizosphaerae]QBI21224.1 FHA domain-containing protein [Egibacter rhizosphaerae]